MFSYLGHNYVEAFHALDLETRISAPGFESWRPAVLIIISLQTIIQCFLAPSWMFPEIGSPFRVGPYTKSALS